MLNCVQIHKPPLTSVLTMALKRFFCFLFVCFFGLGSAKYCTIDSDCGFAESCCSDSVCRETCYYCSYDYQCGTGEECCNGDCLSSCVWTGGAIAGAVVGTIIFFAIIFSIVACFCCACCPYYRYRAPGAVIISQPGYQPFVSTHTTTTQQVQAPPQVNYNQPPPPGYSQPPPPYPSYPPAQTQYPPPHGQAQAAPMPPPVGAGQPVKY